MKHLPVLSAKELIKGLSKLGYKRDHQSGSNIILRNKKYPFRRITVPNHKEIAKGTLRAIIRQTGLTLKEFKQLI